jgi:hypothetical protein
MEIGLDPEMPTCSDGLGILAGETIRSAADLQVPIIAATPNFYSQYPTEFTLGEDCLGCRLATLATRRWCQYSY